MNLDLNNPLFLYLGFMLLIMVVFGLGMMIQQFEESDNMRACVEAGKSWTYNDDNNHYECR